MGEGQHMKHWWLGIFSCALTVHLAGMETNNNNNSLSCQLPLLSIHENKRSNLIPSLQHLSINAWINHILGLKACTTAALIEKQLEGLPDYDQELLIENVNNYGNHKTKSNLLAINKTHTRAVYDTNLYTWPQSIPIEALNAESAAFCPTDFLAYNEKNSKNFKLLNLNTGDHHKDYLDLNSYIRRSTPIDTFLCPHLSIIVINPLNTPLIFLWNNPIEAHSPALQINLKPGMIQAIDVNHFTSSLFYSKGYDPKAPALYELDLPTLTVKKDCFTGGKINSIAVSPENKMVATASDDTTARLWDINSSKPQIVICNHPEKVRSIALHGHHIATGTSAPEGTVYLWDIRKIKNPLKSFQLPSKNSSAFMRARYGEKAKPAISFLSFKHDGTSLVIQNESYEGPKSYLFERFIGQKSVNLQNLKLITTSYALKKKQDENNNN